jgi:hypothetical protein
MRRMKGVTGAVRLPALSSSSMALSSIESEFVDMLARRRRAEAVVGEVPDRPTVVTDSLRRGSLIVDAKGVGKLAAGGCAIELARKRLVKALEVTDPRRCCRAISLGLLGFESEIFDMLDERIGKPVDTGIRIFVSKCGRISKSPETVPMRDPQGWPVRAAGVASGESACRALGVGRATDSYV